jgi:peptide/nickel transport system substrate-binding protein
MRKLSGSVLALVLLVSLLGSACTPTEVEVTKIVKETVVETVVETILETVVVEGTPVVQEVEVTKEVVKEVVVTATPEPLEYEIERVTGMLLADEGTINPYTYNSGSGDNFIYFQFESLHVRDENGVPQPWLAIEHVVSDDYLTHSLTLEEGITWADGTPFTAADVAFSFEYYTTYEHVRFTPPLAKFESATVVDDTHVDIMLSEPDADFVINYLVETPMLPKHLWESVTEPPVTNENDLGTGRNVGTGPYILKEYVPEEFYRFEANPNYWAGTPRAKEIVVLLYADMTSALAAFQAQELDMMFLTVPPEQLNLFEAMPGVEVAQGPLYGTTLLVVDNQLPPFDVKEVRQAISLAIDRQDIVDTVLLGAGTAGSAGWIHPDQAIFNREVVTEYNPEKANELLDGLGYMDTDGDGIREFDGQPMSFEFNARAGNAQWMRSTELIAEMLLDVGIEAVVTPVEETTFWDKIWPGWDVNNGRNYQISLSGWSPPLQLIPTRVKSMLYSDLSVGRFNLTGTANPAFDQLLDEIDAEVDPEVRTELLKELQALIADEVPLMSLFHVDGLFPYWEEVIDDVYFVVGDGPLNPFSFLPLSARP